MHKLGSHVHYSCSQFSYLICFSRCFIVFKHSSFTEHDPSLNKCGWLSYLSLAEHRNLITFRQPIIGKLLVVYALIIAYSCTSSTFLSSFFSILNFATSLFLDSVMNFRLSPTENRYLHTVIDWARIIITMYITIFLHALTQWWSVIIGHCSYKTDYNARYEEATCVLLSHDHDVWGEVHAWRAADIQIEPVFRCQVLTRQR